jgi:hypothetical protein
MASARLPARRSRGATALGSKPSRRSRIHTPWGSCGNRPVSISAFRLMTPPRSWVSQRMVNPTYSVDNSPRSSKWARMGTRWIPPRLVSRHPIPGGSRLCSGRGASPNLKFYLSICILRRRFRPPPMRPSPLSWDVLRFGSERRGPIEIQRNGGHQSTNSVIGDFAGAESSHVAGRPSVNRRFGKRSRSASMPTAISVLANTAAMQL